MMLRCDDLSHPPTEHYHVKSVEDEATAGGSFVFRPGVHWATRYSRTGRPDVSRTHEHEPWMLASKVDGTKYCRACGDDVAPSRTRDTADLSPSVAVQHRCPQMGEHLPSDGLGRPGDGDGLPVPCPDCYSIVVTTIRVPWQPSRDFTIVEDPS